MSINTPGLHYLRLYAIEQFVLVDSSGISPYTSLDLISSHAPSKLIITAKSGRIVRGGS